MSSDEPLSENVEETGHSVADGDATETVNVPEQEQAAERPAEQPPPTPQAPAVTHPTETVTSESANTVSPQPDRLFDSSSSATDPNSAVDATLESSSLVEDPASAEPASDVKATETTESVTSSAHTVDSTEPDEAPSAPAEATAEPHDPSVVELSDAVTATVSAEPESAALAGEITTAEKPSAEAHPPTEATKAQPEEPAASPAEGSKSRARRVQLNPTLNEQALKPVPSILPAESAGGPGTVVETDPAAVEAESGAALESSTGPPQTVTADDAPSAVEAPPPVDLPPKVEQLDAELEAEIEAAVAQEAEAVSTADVQAATESAEEQASEEILEPGARLKGKVQSIHEENVFVELGLRSPGIVSLRQFVTGTPPAVGQELDVIVDRVDQAEGLILLNLLRGKRRIAGNWDAVSKGQVVDCLVTKTNKGGLEITVSNLRGFMPASQIDLRYVADLEPYVGQKLRAIITEANPRKRNLIVSRRVFLDMERKDAAKELWTALEVGQQFSGTVKTLKNYGAFVDIGGIDAFLHIGQISWTRLNHPSDVLQEGQQIEVQVLNLDPENKKISLGMKQLTQDPWTIASAKYQSGSTVTGRVTRTMDFGAFVELEPGVEGLVHISELDYRRVSDVTAVLNVGQEVNLKVMDVDSDRRRIGLSLKQLQEKPQPAEPKAESRSPSSDRESARADDSAERKRKGPLKGGTGGDSGHGLFGNPRDFS